MHYECLGDWLVLARSLLGDLPAYQYLTEGVVEADIDPQTLLSRALEYYSKPDIVAPSAAIWQLGNMFKKFRFGCDPSLAQVAMDSFADRDSRVEDRLDRRIANRMKALLTRALPPVDDSDLDGRFGPGAVAERMNSIERWEASCDFSYDARSMCMVRRGSWSKVGPARLVAVDKDFTKKRLITVEPVENSFGQQFVRSLLLKSVRSGPLGRTVMALRSGSASAGIPTEAAEKQRRRCVYASTHPYLSTLDLKDASDAISWHSVQRVFPVWAVAWLERFRTPEFISGDKSVKTLNMYAGMGNATTFIVETLYFWALFTAISENVNDHTEVSVFGDDVICGTETCHNSYAMGQLAGCGHTLSLAKCGISRAPGFRESCGVAAYSGMILPTLIRVPGYQLDTPQGIDGMCELARRFSSTFTGTDADAIYARFSIELSEVLIDLGVPNLPYPLNGGGMWLCEKGLSHQGQETYTGTCAPLRMHPHYQVPQARVWTCRPARPEYKTVRHLGSGLIHGLLNGQLKTDWADKPVKSPAKTAAFEAPNPHRRCQPIHRIGLASRETSPVRAWL